MKPLDSSRNSSIFMDTGVIYCSCLCGCACGCLCGTKDSQSSGEFYDWRSENWGDFHSSFSQSPVGT